MAMFGLGAVMVKITNIVKMAHRISQDSPQRCSVLVESAISPYA